MSAITLTAIGTVHSTRREVLDDDWDRERAYIELDPNQLSAEALLGLEAFSHVEVLFHMDRVKPESIERSARHPRNNPDWPKVGILAQRGKNRPNQIGTTICRVLQWLSFTPGQGTRRQQLLQTRVRDRLDEAVHQEAIGKRCQQFIVRQAVRCVALKVRSSSIKSPCEAPNLRPLSDPVAGMISTDYTA